MGKSQETMGKKEMEKKKEKKRQDKEIKKEERKANSSKGKSLDDMMAYIDENGDITNTPPDPSKRIAINLEDIQIGVLKQELRAPVEVVKKGTVTFFNDAKGYGFISEQQTQQSIFVHANSLSEPIKERDRVTFEVERGPKGPVAVKVKKV